MEVPVAMSRQSSRLIQLGVLEFLLALFLGVAIPHFAVPRLGLSAHLVGIAQAVFLVVMGLLWPKLKFSRGASSVAFCLLIYGCLAAWASTILAAAWGAGSTNLPMAAGAALGSSFQETVITIGLRSSALSLIAALVMILWGTRGLSKESL
jgi:hydroxylaminobenzene mutase